MFSPADRAFMREALELAARGLYTTTPNPRVGCVLVRDGQVIGRGFHERAGLPHAETNALADARARGADPAGATAYVTLEPCSHHGRTPPCADALVAARIGRVVAAMGDPNPKVAGAGFERLRSAGILVESCLMEDEARELNIGFVARMTRGTPWVRLKVAASLDGRTALADGHSQWITGEAARADGHHWRARACAILTGIGTVRDDDPQLNVRHVATPRQPHKVLVDSRLEVSPGAKLFRDGRVLVACARDDGAKRAALEAAGAEVLVLPNPHGKVELTELLAELGRRQINEIHVESGFKLNGSMLREGCVDELLVYLAPSVLGDTAHGMFHLAGLDSLEAAQRLAFASVERVGEDLRILAKVRKGAD